MKQKQPLKTTIYNGLRVAVYMLFFMSWLIPIAAILVAALWIDKLAR